MTSLAFQKAFVALARLHATHPELAAFAPFDMAAEPTHLPASPVPAAAMLQALAGGATPEIAAFIAACAEIAEAARWDLIYTEDEVGRDFLDNYGFIELVGPEGHYRSEQTRAFIGYWGPNLHYPWHVHQAEELYLVLEGEGIFEAEGEAPRRLGPGETQFHASMEPHALTTGDSPLLCLVLWRGEGFFEMSRMGTE